MKRVLVCGAGGFIGSHLVEKLKNEGLWVRGADLKYPEFEDSHADDFMIGDLGNQTFVEKVVDQDSSSDKEDTEKDPKN